DDAHDRPRQIRPDGCGAHLESRAAVAVAILVLAGVDVSHDDHRIALAQGCADAGDHPAPAIDGDEQRIAGLPVAVGRPAARVAGDPEFDDLLVTHPATLWVVDDVADHGDGRLKHCCFLSFS